MNKRTFALLAILTCLVLSLLFKQQIYHVTEPLIQKLKGQKTTADRIVEFGDSARTRLITKFREKDTAYPPTKVVLIAVKDESILELFAHPLSGPPVSIHRYSVLKQSGNLGPKLKEGDYQVPEGVYDIESLNPNSNFHVSLRLNYPNEYDLQRAKEDGRSELGGDIFIHGGASSIGCLAMGDSVIEEIFTLANDVGIENMKVISVPIDFRSRHISEITVSDAAWFQDLYEQLKTELSEYK